MPELRKQNRINSIHSSLAIENNKLSEKELITWEGLNEKDPNKKYKLKQ